MLKVYKAESQQDLNQFINNTMNLPSYKDWTFMRKQHDVDAPNAFPAKFVIIYDITIKLCNIELLIE